MEVYALTFYESNWNSDYHLCQQKKQCHLKMSYYFLRFLFCLKV